MVNLKYLNYKQAPYSQSTTYFYSNIHRCEDQENREKKKRVAHKIDYRISFQS